MLPWMWGLAVQTVLRSSNVSLDTCLRLWRLLWERIVGSYQCRSWNNSFFVSMVIRLLKTSTIDICFINDTVLSKMLNTTIPRKEMTKVKWSQGKRVLCCVFLFLMYCIYPLTAFMSFLTSPAGWNDGLNGRHAYILYGHIGVKQNIYGGNGT